MKSDLSGKFAIVTGGRIKIGLHTALRLLRDGAFVIVTTRCCCSSMVIWWKLFCVMLVYTYW